MCAEEKIARLLTNHYDILRSSQQLVRHFTTAAGSPLLLPPRQEAVTKLSAKNGTSYAVYNV